MKFAITLAALAGLATTEAATHFASPSAKFDYATAMTGSADCAVVSVVMDESGSMAGEQAFMKNTAVPDIVAGLKGKGMDHVFVCTYGYGSGSHHDGSGGIQPQHWHGCSEGFDAGIFNFVVDGAHEDSFRAIVETVDDLPAVINSKNLHSTCKSLKKNMIVVTDEDSDHAAISPTTRDQAWTAAKNNGWIVNIVCNCKVKSGGVEYLGASPKGNDVVLYKQAGTSFSKVPGTGKLENHVVHAGGWAEDSHEDYPPISRETGGAIWDLNKLRLGGDTEKAFSAAFIDIKVEEVIKNTAAPTKPPTTRVVTGLISGDPHVKLWNGETFDFHGGCDLVVASVPEFANGLGLDVHIRTKIRTWWSYVETAVVRIGSDTFEVKGGKNTASYWVNGVEGKLGADGDLPETVGGFKVFYRDHSKKQKDFRIELGNGDKITFQTFNEFVRVDLKAADENSQFNGARGLMGVYPNGEMLDREGHVVKDHNEFGKEWQVRATEAKLFHTIEGVQHPQECRMPDFTESRKKRRLGEVMITEDEAHLACARVAPEEHDLCVSDVLATNDKEMAGVY